jgi:hypothetical protein
MDMTPFLNYLRINNLLVVYYLSKPLLLPMRSILTLLLVFAVFLTPCCLNAQGAHDANIRFGKVDRSGLIAEYPFSKGITENALRARLEQAGLGKPKSDKGFMSFQAVKWAGLSETQFDVYAKVDAGKGDKLSTVILLVSKGYDNYVSAASDPDISAQLKTFLNSLLPDIRAQQLLADIDVQEDLVRRAEKEYKDADDDGNKLSRERERLDKQISENVSEKQKRADALSVAKARLDQMKTEAKK